MSSTAKAKPFLIVTLDCTHKVTVSFGIAGLTQIVIINEGNTTKRVNCGSRLQGPVAESMAR